MNTVRKIFLALFVFSTLGVLVLFVNLQISANTLPPPTTQMPPPTKTTVGTQNPNIIPTTIPDGPDVGPSSEHANNMGLTALIGSVITSATSLIGFVTTTVINWRKEKREASLAEVQRKKLEAELEKSQLELEELKKNKVKKRKSSG